jgi:preprotein translocase subunit SecA
LIYKQRDDILEGKHNEIIFNNMIKYVAREIVNLNKDENNESIIENSKVTMLLNNVLFNSNVLNLEYFKNRTLDDAKIIIEELLKMSIDIRLDCLKENSNNIIKDILIQNLDFQ